MKKVLIIITIIAVSLISFTLGRITSNSNSSGANASSQVLREGGYSYIGPILLTDHGNDQTSIRLAGNATDIENLIQNFESDKKLDSASVYYRNLNSGEQINVNGDAKYFPASLSKVPLMMAYYKLAEKEPSILTSAKRLELTQDHNSGQEIKATKEPHSGQEYTVQQLIDFMIKYSDNAGFNVLFGQAQSDSALRGIFEDLELFYPYDQSLTKDVFSPKEYSRFLRLLYNATYLNEADSERALKLMSEVDYKNGLVVGVDKDVKVAHKFGLHTQRDGNGILIGRQLHDCGIVYKPNNPYLLCVMTKSGSGELAEVEKTIAEVSKYIYDHVATN